MFTRLKVAWWALLGRPIIYRATLIGGAVRYDKRHGPLRFGECTLDTGLPLAPGPDGKPRLPVGEIQID